MSVVAACGPTGCSLIPPDSRALGLDGGPCRIGARRFDHYLTPGKQEELELGLSEVCYPLGGRTEFDVATDVKVELLDPDGKPYPFFASKPFQRKEEFSDGKFFDNLVQVLFTPDRPGTWRLHVQFEPGIGETRQEVEAVEWHGDAGFRVVDWRAPANCVPQGVTDRGTAFCLWSQGSFVDLESARGEVLRSRAVAVERDTLWRLTCPHRSNVNTWIART